MNDPASDAPQPRVWAWTALYAAAVASFTLAHMNVEPYDDGHFFKRVAWNALETGRLTWNRDEPPVYGSTSQLFQWLALPVAAIAPSHYMMVMRLLAIVCLAGAFAVMMRLTRGFDHGLSAAAAFVSPVMLYPVLSGMETALAFVLIAAVLALTFGEPEQKLHWTLLPALAALVYLARPDALLLVVPPLLVERWARTRKLPVREIALLTAMLGSFLLIFRLYYGTALPLPFYAKQLAFSPYDAHFIRVSADVRVRFGLFAAFAFPLLVWALYARDRVNTVLIASALAFILYHYMFTIDVMGMHGRFYAPALPVLVLAAARGVRTLSDRGSRWGIANAAVVLAMFGGLSWLHWLPKNHDGFVLERVEPATYAWLIPAIALACLAATRRNVQAPMAAALLVVAIAAHAPGIRAARLRVYSDDDFLNLQTSRYTVYRGLDTLRACLGEDIHVYHSEVGLPGLRFAQGKVSDLVGLLSKEWLFEGKGRFDTFCMRDRPQAIFLPHKNYRQLNRQIARGSCIRGYQRVVADSSSPLFIRKDLYPQFRACAAPRRDPFLILP